MVRRRRDRIERIEPGARGVENIDKEIAEQNLRRRQIRLHANQVAAFEDLGSILPGGKPGHHGLRIREIEMVGKPNASRLDRTGKIESRRPRAEMKIVPS